MNIIRQQGCPTYRPPSVTTFDRISRDYFERPFSKTSSKFRSPRLIAPDELAVWDQSVRSSECDEFADVRGMRLRELIAGTLGNFPRGFG